ncbi:DUF7855 family protein [Halopenitus persicus]|uniref:Uncharacterized protein n=1 Tax=Halopenitus persicus TaxID=1048396 RepID=A0A1H3FRE0_9EURY|nr:hypothetical protein [Halopenitus persicus]QHS16767.1 hypothetical protein GWK26_06190 [haloarchaeon 3A1-DGR]SDX93642.1 hypothetical protein SAMN05216564_102183 [Halopenitus persicus]
MLLVMVYSQGARTALRNVCRSHEEVVVRRFGRAAVFEETAYGAFLALRLRAAHEGDVQVERTSPFNEFEAVEADVREAASAYATRESPATPYAKFAAGTRHPDPETLRDRSL